MLSELLPVETLTRTVLVADDQPMTLALTARMPGSLGYTVLTTSTPDSALVLAEGGAEIDGVLTDLTMPDRSGQELAQRLGTVVPDVPVVFMSGFPEDLSKTLEDGRRRIHLDKPFSIAALHVAVRAAMG